jgi:hypothetical protein
MPDSCPSLFTLHSEAPDGITPNLRRTPAAGKGDPTDAGPQAERTGGLVTPATRRPETTSSGFLLATAQGGG